MPRAGLRFLRLTIRAPANSQSPQSVRHGNADPYHFEGDVSFGNVHGPALNDVDHENAAAWEFQGKGGDQMYDVRKS
jgi:hypothetical protein